MDLNHLNLRVRDAEACREFYQDHFAFEPAFEADGGYFLRNADGFLLALVPAPNHAALPEGVHIGFGLEGREAVRSSHHRLDAAGVEVGVIEDSEDYVTFRCWDPDGTEIEVFWERS
jgi:catechol 2,3-dioxygenase-like lactoylglutathione lyase family enzyme